MTKAQLIALLTATSVGFGVGKLTDFTSSKTGASGTFIHATRVTPQGVTAWRTEARAQTDGGVLLTDVGEAACGALTPADIVERERAVTRCPLAPDDRPQVWEARPAPALPDGGAQVAIEVYGRSSRCAATVPRWAGLQRWLDGLKCTTVVVNAGTRPL
ncbi:MAG: hypothetical protein KA310_03510 [Pseudomonadales bacterium]|nr:hypothetical protein [Pseudomonadales bacterium]